MKNHSTCLMVINISWLQRIMTCRIRPRDPSQRGIWRDAELHILGLTGSFLSVLLLVNIICLVQKVYTRENTGLDTYRSTHWFCFSKLTPQRAWFWKIGWSRSLDFIVASPFEPTLDGSYLEPVTFLSIFI